MTEHGTPDIVEQIDALTQDSAAWTATGTDERPAFNNPSDGGMAAIHLGMSSGGIVEIDRADPVADLVRRVGDPGLDRMRPLRGVQFWVGGNSVVTAPVNHAATRFLHHVLGDVRDGDYIASDRERDHARTLLDHPEEAPVIHGPCLVTGVGDDDAPGPLGENFQGWFAAAVDKLAAGARAELLAVAAEMLGIPVDDLGQIVVVVH